MAKVNKIDCLGPVALQQLKDTLNGKSVSFKSLGGNYPDAQKFGKRALDQIKNLVGGGSGGDRVGRAIWKVSKWSTTCERVYPEYSDQSGEIPAYMLTPVPDTIYLITYTENQPDISEEQIYDNLLAMIVTGDSTNTVIWGYDDGVHGPHYLLISTLM